MTYREKLLAGGLLAVVGLWQANVQYKNFIVAPVIEREDEVAARQDRIAKKEIEVARANVAMRKYKTWKQRSLPPDPVNALSLYHNWLIELANRSKLSAIVVTANPTGGKVTGDTYSTVSAELKAQGPLANVRDFLYEFGNSGLLHRIGRLTLTSKQATGDPAIELSMTVEGLSLKEAPARGTLLSDPNLAQLVKDPSARSKDDYAALTQKSLFVRGYNGPPGRVNPAEDPRQFVRLTSTFSNGGDFDATLYDPTTNKTARLFAGADFNLGGVEGRVVSVAIDFVVLEIKGERFRLELGRNLTELEKLPETANIDSGAGG